MIVTMTARVPAAGLRAFELYEDTALSLLGDHGATLERRLRSADRTVEVHVLRFPDRAAYDRYLQDPRRKSRRQLLEVSGAETQVLEDLEDVPA